MGLERMETETEGEAEVSGLAVYASPCVPDMGEKWEEEVLEVLPEENECEQEREDGEIEVEVEGQPCCEASRVVVGGSGGSCKVTEVLGLGNGTDIGCWVPVAVALAVTEKGKFGKQVGSVKRVVMVLMSYCCR